MEIPNIEIKSLVTFYAVNDDGYVLNEIGFTVASTGKDPYSSYENYEYSQIADYLKRTFSEHWSADLSKKSGFIEFFEPPPSKKPRNYKPVRTQRLYFMKQPLLCIDDRYFTLNEINPWDRTTPIMDENHDN